MSERTFSVAELAERYAVSEHTVLGWIKSGELKAINVGRGPHKRRPRWRITSEALAAFEQARTSTPAAPAPNRRKRRTDDDVVEFY